MTVLMAIYLGIVAICLCSVLWGLFFEKDLAKAINRSILCIPLILRLLLVK